MAAGQGGAGGTLTRAVSGLSLTAMAGRRYWLVTGHHPGAALPPSRAPLPNNPSLPLSPGGVVLCDTTHDAVSQTVKLQSTLAKCSIFILPPPPQSA